MRKATNHTSNYFLDKKRETLRMGHFLDERREEFFKSIPKNNRERHLNETLLNIEPIENWGSDIQLFDYLTEDYVDTLMSYVYYDHEGAKKLSSNTEFDNFFLRYYELVILGKKTSFVIKRKKLEKEELQEFNNWKSNSLDKIDIGHATTVLFCTCKGYLISDFVDNMSVENISVFKKLLAELLSVVITYYKEGYQDGEMNVYNTSNFMYGAFRTLANLEEDRYIGVNPWREWKEFYKFNLVI